LGPGEEDGAWGGGWGRDRGLGRRRGGGGKDPLVIHFEVVLDKAYVQDVLKSQFLKG
jgi:hypothetical protein